MLVLSRKRGEKIKVLDENRKVIAEIFVLRTSAGRVKLGFEAESKINFVREK